MGRLIDTVVELGLGGSYFGRVVEDADVRVADWRMDLLTDVYAGGVAGQMMIANKGVGFYGPLPTGYKGLRLYAGASIITDRLQRQVTGVIPDGWPGFRFTASASEWGQMVGESSDQAQLIHTLEWVGTFKSLPGAEVALVDQVSASTTPQGFGLWFDASGVVHGKIHTGSVVNSAALSLDTLYHIVLTRSGTAGSQVWRLYINGVLVDTSITLTGVIVSSTPVVLVAANAHTTPSVFLDAIVYHIGLYRSDTLDPLDGTAIGNHWAALQWTDISTDLLADHGAEIVSVERGFRGHDVLTRVAAPGECVISLDNTSLNSGGLAGYYSPGHTNCRAGFGRGVRVRVTMEGVGQFVGQAETIQVDPGTRGMRFTRMLVRDIFHEAADTRLAGVPLLEEVRSDVMFEVATSRLSTLPAGLRIVRGRDTYPLAFDNARDETVSVDDEWRRIQGSEFGLTYQRGDGTLVFEGRGTRVQEHISPVLALDPVAHLDGLEVSDIAAHAITRVEVKTHAKTEGASPEVLAAAETPIYVEGTLHGGTPIKVVLPYRSLTGLSLHQRVGGKDMIAPASGTDWNAWHQVGPDGTGQGFEQTADTTVSASFGPNSVELTLTNNHIFGTYFFGLQARGTAIFDFRESVTLVEADAATLQRDGVRPLAVDMKYQDDPEIGRAIGRWVLAAQVSPVAQAVLLRPNVDVTSPDMLALDISDRVTVTDPQTGISADYHIHGLRVAVGASGVTSLRWWLSPADPNKYWVLGVTGASELGETTELFPA